jgi:hypothetical protein
MFLDGVEVGANQEDEEDTASFKMTETSLLQAGKESYFRVSQAFERLGWGREPPNGRGETNGWGVLLRFQNRDGKERDLFVSSASLHGEIGALCASLADAGMDS